MQTIEEAIKQGRFANEYQKLTINLIYTSSLIGICHQRFFRPYGLTMQQFNVLRILRGQKGQPIGVNELGERMLDQSSNASRLVEKLREKKLVSRQVSMIDRRQAEVVITSKGSALLTEIDAEMPQLHNTTAALNEEEAKTLNALLDKLRSAEIFDNINHQSTPSKYQSL